MEPQAPSQNQTMPTNQPAAAQMQPLYQDTCWYRPKGKSNFGVVKATASLYPGWLIVQNQATGQELVRVALSPDTHMISSFGVARFKRLNGQAISMFNGQYQVIFYNIRLFLITMLIVVVATWTVRGGGLLGVVGLAIIFSGVPKAKKFAAAAGSAIPRQNAQPQQPVA